MNICRAELCAFWTGDGCVCDVLSITPERTDEEGDTALRDELYEIADQYGGCVCDPAFSERNREDPRCRFHERRELMDEILAAGWRPSEGDG